MNSPILWERLLGDAPKGSVLMGGAVVDYIAGHEAKDYDIFYSYKPGLQPVLPEKWVLSEAQFNDPEWVAQHHEQYLQGVDANGNSPISTVYEYIVAGLHKVQLIGVNYDNPLDHLKNFDHSLTLGWYTKNGMSVHRKVFESLHTKVIRYVSKNLDKKAVSKSYARALNKAHKYGPDAGWLYGGFAH